MKAISLYWKVEMNNIWKIIYCIFEMFLSAKMLRTHLFQFGDKAQVVQPSMLGAYLSISNVPPLMLGGMPFKLSV